MAKEFIDSFIEDDVDLIDDGKCDKVVYLHRRADDGLPFYVGIGGAYRPYTVHGRNQFWTNVYRKHGRTVELLHTGLSVADAKRIEIELIAKFRSEYPGLMTNLTDGGDGLFGLFGEEHGQFKGSVVGVSLDNKFFIVLDGTRAIKEAGFEPMNVYPCLNGRCEHHRRMRWSRPSIVDRSQFDGLTEIFHVSELGIDFNAPEYHQNFSGFSVGISKCRSKFIILAGTAELIDAGLDKGAVSSCISGRVKSHKNFFWYRMKVFNSEDFAGLSPVDQRSADRLEEFKI